MAKRLLLCLLLMCLVFPLHLYTQSDSLQKVFIQEVINKNNESLRQEMDGLDKKANDSITFANGVLALAGFVLALLGLVVTGIGILGYIRISDLNKQTEKAKEEIHNFRTANQDAIKKVEDDNKAELQKIQDIKIELAKAKEDFDKKNLNVREKFVKLIEIYQYWERINTNIRKLGERVEDVIQKDDEINTILMVLMEREIVEKNPILVQECNNIISIAQKAREQVDDILEEDLSSYFERIREFDRQLGQSQEKFIAKQISIITWLYIQPLNLKQIGRIMEKFAIMFTLCWHHKPPSALSEKTLRNILIDEKHFFDEHEFNTLVSMKKLYDELNNGNTAMILALADSLSMSKIQTISNKIDTIIKDYYTQGKFLNA